MTPRLSVEDEEERAAAVVRAVGEGLDAFNLAAADLASSRPLVCAAWQQPSGELVGGAVGRTWGACGELRMLWVDAAHRGRGIGRGLVELVEAQARRRGCALLVLDTFSFQAPGFYDRLGYEVAWTVTGFPGGVSRFYLRKALA